PPLPLHSFPTRRSSDLLRLDHPELGEVAAGVGVLGAKRRAESVDVGERERGGLGFELARYREVRLAPEEVLREVDATLRAARGRSEEHTSELQSRSDLV